MTLSCELEMYFNHYQYSIRCLPRYYAIKAFVKLLQASTVVYRLQKIFKAEYKHCVQGYIVNNCRDN